MNPQVPQIVGNFFPEGFLFSQGRLCSMGFGHVTVAGSCEDRDKSSGSISAHVISVSPEGLLTSQKGLTSVQLFI